MGRATAFEQLAIAGRDVDVAGDNATRLCSIDRIIKIAVGRDAADSAFATYYGQLGGPPKSITVRHVDGDRDADEDWTVNAVSLSN
jgi:hypothetical protein